MIDPTIQALLNRLADRLHPAAGPDAEILCEALAARLDALGDARAAAVRSARLEQVNALTWLAHLGGELRQRVVCLDGFRPQRAELSLARHVLRLFPEGPRWRSGRADDPAAYLTPYDAGPGCVQAV